MGCFSPPQARLVNKMLSRLWTYIVIQREYFLLTESMNTMMYCYYIQNYCTFKYYGLIIFFNLNCWKEEGDVKEESLKLLLQKAPANKQRMARQKGGHLLCNKIHLSTRMTALYTLRLTFWPRVVWQEKPLFMQPEIPKLLKLDCWTRWLSSWSII